MKYIQIKNALFFLLTMITSLNSSAMENDNSAAKSTNKDYVSLPNPRHYNTRCAVCKKHVIKKTHGFCGEEKFDFNFFAQHALLLERFHELHENYIDEDYIDKDEKISFRTSSKKTLELITCYKKILESKDAWKNKYDPLIQAMHEVLNCTTKGSSPKEMEGVREQQCSKLTKEYFSDDKGSSYDYGKVITAFCLISSWDPFCLISSWDPLYKRFSIREADLNYLVVKYLSELPAPKEIACLEDKLETVQYILDVK